MPYPEPLSLTEQAKRYTPEDVAEFLQSVGLGQYAEKFVEDDIRGDMLIEVEEADDEMLIEAGVQSPLHRIKIMVFFKSLVKGTSTR